MNKPKVLIIVGATASGKSDLSIKLAQIFKGQIISGDSVSIYRDYNIGSAKPDQKTLSSTKHYLIDELSAFEDYSIFEFQKQARKAIKDISTQQMLPIIVGGSGLYIKACIYDYRFSLEKNSENNYDSYSNLELKTMLDERDLQASLKIHLNNRRRLIRALEICDNLNQKKSQFEENQNKEKIYDCLIIGLKKPRSELYQDIEQRVELMFKQGLLQEIETLNKQGIAFKANSFNKAIGYKEFKDYFEGKIDLDTVKRLIIKHTKNYAKRQETWFNNQEQVEWYHSNETDRIIERIRGWLNE